MTIKACNNRKTRRDWLSILNLKNTKGTDLVIASCFSIITSLIIKIQAGYIYMHIYLVPFTSRAYLLI